MKVTLFFTVAILMGSLASCSLLGSVLKLPASVLQTVGRTVGVSGLTDEASEPLDADAEEPVEEDAGSVLVGTKLTDEIIELDDDIMILKDGLGNVTTYHKNN